MVHASLAARLLLTIVFGIAAIAKLSDREGFRDTLRAFGMPQMFAGPLAILLPVAELAIACSLLFTGSTWWGAVAAVALLLVFIAAIAANLARGRKPRCRCFGQLHSAPIGWPTLARNLVLATAAGLIVGHGRNNPVPSVVAWISEQPPFTTTLVGLLLLQTVFVILIVKQQGRMLRRLDILEGQFARGGGMKGLAVATPAPAFALPNLQFETVTLDTLRARSLPVVLFFIDPNCGPCEGLLPKLAQWQRDYGEQLTMVAISRGTEKENRAKIKHHRIGDVLLQQDHEVDNAYKIEGTPTAVLVRPDGLVGSPPATAEEDIESLIAGIVGKLGPSPLLRAVPINGNGQAATGTVAA